MTHPASGPPGAALHHEVPCAGTAWAPVIECHMVDRSSLRSLMTQLMDAREEVLNRPPGQSRFRTGREVCVGHRSELECHSTIASSDRLPR
jgi:hypothetical protein